MFKIFTQATKKEKIMFTVVIAIALIANVIMIVQKSQKNSSKDMNVSSITESSVAQAKTPPPAEKLESYTPIQVSSPFEPIPVTTNNNSAGTGLNSQAMMNKPPIPNAGQFTGYSGRTPSEMTGSSTGGIVFVRTIAWSSQSNSGNIAILSNGQDDIAVSEGESTRWGRVTSITPKGVSLNGKVLYLNEGQRSEAQQPPIPSGISFTAGGL